MEYWFNGTTSSHTRESLQSNIAENLVASILLVSDILSWRLFESLLDKYNENLKNILEELPDEVKVQLMENDSKID